MVHDGCEDCQCDGTSTPFFLSEVDGLPVCELLGIKLTVSGRFAYVLCACRKIFIGGLSYETTDGKSLRRKFVLGCLTSTIVGYHSLRLTWKAGAF